MDIQQLITDHRDWFYVVSFVWAFFEGETFVIFAGAAAAQGMLNLWGLMLTAGLGSFLGDQLYFWLGRHFGPKLMARFPKWEPNVEVALDYLRRYDIWFVLSFRFIYGIRNVSSFACGTSGIAWQRFFVLNLIAATVWVLVFAGTGYLLGVAFQELLEEIANDFGFVMLGVFVVVTIILYTAHRRGKARVAAMKAELAARHAAEAERERARPPAA
ncbi:MAG: DedA family protein [Alphaproteobacteria bacterium]|nr:DedA family protein [Alphaproteobacteria bacterium]